MTFKEIAERIDSREDIVVRCDTEEKAQILLSMCRTKGFRWRGGDCIAYTFSRANDTRWYRNNNKTVYYIRTSQDKTVTYGSVVFVTGIWYDAENDDEEICLGGYDISFLLN